MTGNARALRVLLVTSRRRDGRRLCKDATEATPTPHPGVGTGKLTSALRPPRKISLSPGFSGVTTEPSR